MREKIRTDAGLVSQGELKAVICFALAPFSR